MSGRRCHCASRPALHACTSDDRPVEAVRACLPRATRSASPAVPRQLLRDQHGLPSRSRCLRRAGRSRRRGAGLFTFTSGAASTTRGLCRGGQRHRAFCDGTPDLHLAVGRTSAVQFIGSIVAWARYGAAYSASHNLRRGRRAASSRRRRASGRAPPPSRRGRSSAVRRSARCQRWRRRPRPTRSATRRARSSPDHHLSATTATALSSTATTCRTPGHRLYLVGIEGFQRCRRYDRALRDRGVQHVGQLHVDGEHLPAGQSCRPCRAASRPCR